MSVLALPLQTRTGTEKGDPLLSIQPDHEVYHPVAQFSRPNY